MDSDNTERSAWLSVRVLFPRKCSVTGRFMIGPVMVRKVRGKKRYREMTNEESFDFLEAASTS